MKKIQAGGQAKTEKGRKQKIKALAASIRDLLNEGKAEDIMVLDIAARSALADYMVIAGGTSARHISALADRLVQALKEQGHKDIKIEGMGGSDWVLIDEGDIIIHLFRPEARSFYRLEKIWTEPAEQDSEAAERSA